MIKPIPYILDNSQHEFRSIRSTLSCNLSFQKLILKAFTNNCQVNVIYTDFEKAFDRVDHNIVTVTLGQLGFG